MASSPAPEQGGGGPPPHEGGAPHGGQLEDLRQSLREDCCLSLTKYKFTRQVPCCVVDWCVRHDVCHVPWLWQAMQAVRVADLRQEGDVHEPSLCAAAVASEAVRAKHWNARGHICSSCCVYVCVPGNVKQRHCAVSRPAMWFISPHLTEVWYALCQREEERPQGKRGAKRAVRAP